MLQKTNNKLKGKKGFTLMEMLIVVAIIAILLAILIPAFSGALTDSKIKADQANVRAWYAEQMASMMTGSKAAPTEYNGGTLQAGKGAKPVTVSGTTPEDFSVTYTDKNDGTMTFSAKKPTP